METIKTADLHDLTTELSLAIGRLRAVAESFAGEYIDIPEDSAVSAISMNPEHFRSLFSALFAMLEDVQNRAEAVDLAALKLHKES